MTFVERLATDPKALGAAIREVRGRAHWTQAELAERAGVSRAFVIDLEWGRRPGAELSRVLAVIRALGKGVSLVDDRRPSSLTDALDVVLG